MPTLRPVLPYLLALLAATAPLHAEAKRRSAHKVAPPPIPTFPALDKDAAAYDAQAASITKAPECFPINIRDQERIGIVYLHCSDDARARDAEETRISENFTVPEGIARRYNFWRRIYSLWGKEQYVMHLSEYPEVVLEAYDATRLPAELGAIAREKWVKRVAKNQRDEYKRLFMAMHRLRKDETQFTPAMKRLAKVMAHIPSSDKYATAAHTLRLQRGQRDFIATGLAVAPKYLPAIEREFIEQGVPVEISRLAFVESSFNLNARSKVGASGVYQIMPATGRQYLKMHSGVDERNDPIKAARAACKLLKLNYALTGSWPLAITAYNHGVGGIRRAMGKVGSKDIVQLINKYYGNAFGFASKNFFASYLGVLATLKQSDRIFPEVAKVQALAFDTVRLPKAMSIPQLKKKYGVSMMQVADLNPDITRPVLRGAGALPAGYVLKIPAKAPPASQGESPALTVASPPST